MATQRCLWLKVVTLFLIASSVIVIVVDTQSGCDDSLIINNIKGLQRDLAHKLHGQHLVKLTVLSHIRAHINSKSPGKALVLSFHGLPGTGKNFVSTLIANNLYKDGQSSPYVHYISATNDFPHEDMLQVYKDSLKSLIETNVRNCERSMFIIDEVDKIPVTLLDILKPFVDHNPQVNGVDYRKTIFIFLSNAGGTTIQDFMLKRWKDEEQRESLTLNDLENNVMLSALNANVHGLRHCQLIVHHLITAFIPFLPLEKEHVRKCIEDDLVAKDYFRNAHEVRDKLVDDVMKELTFYQIYSTTGCKRVSEKVDLVMMNELEDVEYSDDYKAEL